MRQITHQRVSRLLLAAYGSVAVLGYGLHELLPEDAQHHHGLVTAHQDSGSLTVGASIGRGDDHDCDICVFLDQARSMQPQIELAVIYLHQVAAVTTIDLPLASQTTELSHAPRGPPALVG
jgi:hypothetical protein